MKTELNQVEIDYLFENYLVAFSVTYRNIFGKIDSVYKSGFFYESIDDAYYGAIFHISNKN